MTEVVFFVVNEHFEEFFFGPSRVLHSREAVLGACNYSYRNASNSSKVYHWRGFLTIGQHVFDAGAEIKAFELMSVGGLREVSSLLDTAA